MSHHSSTHSHHSSTSFGVSIGNGSATFGSSSAPPSTTGSCAPPSSFAPPSTTTGHTANSEVGIQLMRLRTALEANVPQTIEDEVEKADMVRLRTFGNGNDLELQALDVAMSGAKERLSVMRSAWEHQTGHEQSIAAQRLGNIIPHAQHTATNALVPDPAMMVELKAAITDGHTSQNKTFTRRSHPLHHPQLHAQLVTAVGLKDQIEWQQQAAGFATKLYQTFANALWTNAAGLGDPSQDAKRDTAISSLRAAVDEAQRHISRAPSGQGDVQPMVMLRTEHQRGSAALTELLALRKGEQETRVGLRPVASSDKGTSCEHCSTKFGVFTWRHHCRQCGALLCSKCSPHERPLPALGYNGKERVCKKCFPLPAPTPPKPTLSDTLNPCRVLGHRPEGCTCAGAPASAPPAPGSEYASNPNFR